MTCRTGCLRRHEKQASAVRTTINLNCQLLCIS